MSWPTASLDDVCLFIRNGKSIQQTKEIDGLPITRIETIADQTIDPSRVGYAGIELSNVKGHLLEVGDILFSHINSLEHLGKCAIYEGEPETLVHGMNLLNLRANPEMIDARYLLRVLRGDRQKAKFLSIANKSVNQASISAGNLKKVEIPLPPLPEQRRIAAILDKADALRAKRRLAIAKLDQLLQSVFLEMFGDPVTNPKGLPIVRMGELTRIKTGKLDANASSEDGVYPFFTCAREPLRISSYSYDCECVLIAGNGDLNVKQYSGKFDAYQRTYIVESVDSNRLTTNFLFYFVDGYLGELRKQSIGGIIKYIKMGNLTEAPLPLPNIDAQKQFNQRCAELLARRNSFSKSADAFELLFASLQRSAFEGQG